MGGQLFFREGRLVFFKRGAGRTIEAHPKLIINCRYVYTYSNSYIIPEIIY